MKLNKLHIIFLTIALFISNSALYANTETEAEKKEVKVKEMIMHHLMDSYEWNIVTTHNTNISIPLPNYKSQLYFSDFVKEVDKS